MRFSSLIPFFAALVLAEDQGKGCNPDKYTMGCSGLNVVKCYTWGNRPSPTWNFVETCEKVCCNGICTDTKEGC
uniref:Uncharacterized protein n=1 Tax=Colletotrichum horii TaxID=717645 RepID=A0AA50E9N6_9PEZI|nr:hypothetical protein [Colletotrichum horii]